MTEQYKEDYQKNLHAQANIGISKPMLISDPMLNEKALYWIVSLTSGEVTQEKLKQCQLWRKKSKAHEHAFQQARTLWLQIGNTEQLNSLNVIMQDVVALPASKYSLFMHIFYSHRYVLIFVFCLLCFSIHFIYTQNDFRTDYGQIETIQLSAHSRITLNTNSALDLNISNQRREIILDKGEAYFQVSNDELSLPMIVHSGDSRIEVNSTAFNIQKNTRETIITVLKGDVTIDHQKIFRQKLTSHQQIKILKNNSFTINEIKDHQLLSWMKGTLQFQNTPINEILNILENYDKKIWIISLKPTTRNIRLNTTIHIKNIDDWLFGLNDLQLLKIKKIGRFVLIYDI